MSYETECVDCSASITASFRYCPHCGVEQPWPDESDA